MEIDKSKSGESRLKLPATLDLAAAEDLHAACLEAVAAQDDFHLDGQDVAKISTACLQILAAADQKLDGGGGGIILENPSQTLTDALLDLGMNSYLDKWSR